MTALPTYSCRWCRFFACSYQLLLEHYKKFHAATV